MFRPDVVLPTQFFAAMRQRVPQEAEYRLVVALLQDAVECYQKHLRARDPKARQLFADAQAWIESDDRAWAFSFVNVCDLLGLNPGYLRHGLLRWKERQLAGNPRPGPRVCGARRGGAESDRASA
jgi:hypothetical protein